MKLMKFLSILFVSLSIFTFPKIAIAQSGVNIPRAKIKILGINTQKVKIRPTDNRVSGLPLDSKSQYLRITVEYYATSSPKSNNAANVKFAWIDKLIFSWSVIMAGNETGKSNNPPLIQHSVLMRKDITYGNVKASITNSPVKHYAVLYIESNAYERYGSKLIRDGIFVKLRVYDDKRLVANTWWSGNDLSTSPSIPANFFRFGSDQNWFESKLIKTDNSGLRGRHETPWEWASYNSYETIISDKLMKIANRKKKK